MKKTIIAVLIIIGIICSTFPTLSFAQEYSGSLAHTNLSYTVDDSNADNYYTVLIPSAIDLNKDTVIPIVIKDCAIDVDKQLVVSLEPLRTFEDNTGLYLYRNKGTADERKMNCRIGMSSNADGSQASYVDMETGSRTLAVFENGNLNPITGGYIVFNPITSGVPSGTYTGTVYFVISVKNAE